MSGLEGGVGSLARRLRAAVDVLLPPACALCGRGRPSERPPVCGLCWSRLPVLAPPRCERCGAPSCGPAAACASCEGWPEDVPRCAAPFAMRGSAARLVRALKYGRWEALAGPMGQAMLDSARRLVAEPHGRVVVEAAGTPADRQGGEATGLSGKALPASAPAVTGGPAPRIALVPVPLSPGRLRERGFNQAEALAAALGGAAGWPVVPALQRRRPGRRQARLGQRGRSANVRGLFGLAGGSDAPLPPPRALIVDDVVTTGATAAACARALREAGSVPVGMVSFARALHELEAP